MLRYGQDSGQISTVQTIAAILQVKAVFIPKGMSINNLDIVAVENPADEVTAEEETGDLVPDDQDRKVASEGLGGIELRDDPERATTKTLKGTSLRTKSGNSRFIERLQAIQTDKDLSLADFAKILGVSTSFASLVLNGKRGVDVKLVYKWSEALELSKEDARKFLLDALAYHLPPKALRILGVVDPSRKKK